MHVCVVYTHHIIFIHSSADGHLGCFHVLAIVSGAAINSGMHVSFWIRDFSRYSPGVGLLDHMVTLFLVFWEPFIMFCIGAAPVYIPTTVWKSSLLSPPSPAFFICRIFNDGHSDQCELVPKCSSDLHFSEASIFNQFRLYSLGGYFPV